MEDNNPEDLYGSQEVAGESKDRPPLEVVNLTAETEVPMDRAEDEPAPENMEPLPVCEWTLSKWPTLHPLAWEDQEDRSLLAVNRYASSAGYLQPRKARALSTTRRHTDFCPRPLRE